MTEATGILRGVVRRTAELDWQPSPVAGVWRKRLELAGAVEAGRVTSVVRFDPGARFPRHPHPDGEEILVLEGVFSDETGGYPAGSHLLNPDGTSHAPWSGPGCTLFVKLRQYPGADRPRMAIDTGAAVWRPGPVEGSELLALYRDPAPGEGFAELIRMAPGCNWGRDIRPDGEEVFVVEGVLEDEHGRHGTGSWLRHWPGGAHRWHSPEGCLLYVKQGHLGRYGEGCQAPAPSRKTVSGRTREGTG